MGRGCFVRSGGEEGGVLLTISFCWLNYLWLLDVKLILKSDYYLYCYVLPAISLPPLPVLLRTCHEYR